MLHIAPAASAVLRPPADSTHATCCSHLCALGDDLRALLARQDADQEPAATRGGGPAAAQPALLVLPVRVIAKGEQRFGAKVSAGRHS